MTADVQTFTLFLFSDAQTYDHVSNLVGNESHDTRPDNRRQHCLELNPNLAAN